MLQHPCRLASFQNPLIAAESELELAKIEQDEAISDASKVTQSNAIITARDLLNAQNLDNAEAALRNIDLLSSQEVIDAAEAQVAEARATLANAEKVNEEALIDATNATQKEVESTKSIADEAITAYEAILAEVAAAQLAFDTASSSSQRALAQIDLNQAKEKVAGAQLDQETAISQASQATQGAVSIAEQQRILFDQNVTDAEATLALLEDTARPEEVEAAQAALEVAKSELASADLEIETVIDASKLTKAAE